MKRLTRTITAAAIALSPLAARAATAPLVTERVDETRRVTLAGNTRPEANFRNDLGPVDDSFRVEHMLLQLKRSPEQETELRKLMDEQERPGAAGYHRWLSADEFDQRFGVAHEDVAAVTTYLNQHGFQVNGVKPSGHVIDFTGTAGQLRETFNTDIHRLNVKGQLHVANTNDPSIPEALAPVVAGIVSLHDFRPHSLYTPRVDYTFSFEGYPYQALVPGDLETIYNLNPLFHEGLTGRGQTIAVLEDTDLYASEDWATFRSTFGLSGYKTGTLDTSAPRGRLACADPGVNSDDFEAILDTEWASAAAPDATIRMAACADTTTTFGGLIALNNLIEERNPPSIISISYGECETFNGQAANLSYAFAYEQAAAEGISVFVAAGDWGAAVCDAGDNVASLGITVNAFASTPDNVAVGGTDFGDTYAGTNGSYWSATNSPTYESALSYIPEIPWNDSCASSLISSYVGYSTPYGPDGFCNSQLGAEFQSVVAGSGGPSGCAFGTPSTSDGVVDGSCQGYPKPWWQSAVGNPSDGVRDLPDVSLFASNGIWNHYYVVCFTDPANGGVPCAGAPSNWAGAGGTSFASPIMAGIQSLAAQKWGAQGNPNPTYYQIAADDFSARSIGACDSQKGASVGSTCTFHDVTVGDNDVDCAGANCYNPSDSADAATSVGVLSTSKKAYKPAYTTKAGWDFASGLGSVNAANLVNNGAWGGGGTCGN